MICLLSFATYNFLAKEKNITIYHRYYLQAFWLSFAQNYYHLEYMIIICW